MPYLKITGLIFAAILFGVGTIHSTPALAENNLVWLSKFSSADFVNECAKRDDLRADSCVAYILGVSDMLSFNDELCLGGDARSMQIVAVVRKFIKDNPEEWNNHPIWLVRTPLLKAFPC